MSVIVVQNRSSIGFVIPDGGIVMFHGDPDTLDSEKWSVVSAVEGAMVKGASEGNLTQSGSWTHSHTNPSLNSVADHNHDYTPQDAFGNGGSNNSHPGYGSSDGALAGHSHYTSVSGGTGAGGHTHSIGVTNSATVYPPYCKLLFIQANGDQPLPVGGIVMWKETLSSRPEGLNLCDGGSYGGVSTPDLRGKFVIGASSTDIGNSGGSSTHSHSQPVTGEGGGHSHPVSGSASGYIGSAINNAYFLAGGATKGVPKSHGHSWSTNTATDQDHSHSVPDTGSTSHIPAYLKVYFLKRTEENSQEFLPGSVILWPSSVSIPSGWQAWSAMVGNYACGASGDSDLLDTGGNSGGHTHSVSTTNSRGDHNHGGENACGTTGSSGEQNHYGGTGYDICKAHTHSGGTFIVGYAGAHSHSFSSSTTGSTTYNPVHVDLIFIEKI